MGVFDFFGKEPKTKNERDSERERSRNLGESFNADNQQGNKSPVSVFSPESFEDVESIIDAMKNGKNTVVHLDKLKSETALRVLDMLSGAIYALNGGVYEMGKNMFMFSPSGLEIR